MAMAPALSWGRYPRLVQARVQPAWRDQVGELMRASCLPYGAGRSYGDSCQNEGGTLVDLRSLDRLVRFDAAAGELVVEAGMTLADLVRFTLPRGWFPPVTPGTLQVTVGGAIANDVHGKNHHLAGTFGRHVRALTLLRSDGTTHVVAPGDDLFAATVGGMGLTGAILDATLALRRVRSARLEAESLAFTDLAGFFALAEASREWEYTAAWLDCAGARSGRGVLQRARHVEADDGSLAHAAPPGMRPVPFDFPAWALSIRLVRAFNALYFRATPHGAKRTDLLRFLYPLDALAHWNRIYGRRGFVQFQCVVPMADAPRTLRTLLDAIVAAGEGSFLSVVKTFGDVPSPGMMSFPRHGATFALDFPMRGAATLALLARLEAIVLEAGGAIYPAKDACMSPRAFAAAYPAAERFRTFIDPACSSSFWRRVQASS